MMKVAVLWPAVGAAVVTTASAAAQVNIEPLRAKLEDEGVGGKLDAQISGRAGNTKGLTMGGAGLFGGRTGAHFAFAAGTADYSRINESTQIQRYFVHARYSHTVAERLEGEVFGQLEHDAFQRLTLRRLVGAGPRVLVLRGDVTLYVGTAYMWERESLSSDEDDPNGNLELENHRWSNSLNLLWTVDDRITVSTTTLVQPRFDAFSDYRVLSVNSAGFAVTKVLAAGLTVTVRYDSRPPRNVLRTDALIQNTLGVTF